MNNQIGEYRKLLYKALLKEYSDQFVTKTLIYTALHKTYSYQEMVNFMHFTRALPKTFKIEPEDSFVDEWDFYIELGKHWYPKFIKWYQRKIVSGKRLNLPHIDKTRAIQEFINRGFIHKDEANINFTQVHIKTSIGELVYPKNFESQQEALPLFEGIGIPGYTKIHLPKTK